MRVRPESKMIIVSMIDYQGTHQRKGRFQGTSTWPGISKNSGECSYKNYPSYPPLMWTNSAICERRQNLVHPTEY